MERMAALAESESIVVLDVPLMVESKRGYPVAGLLVVDVDPEAAVQRLVEHRSMREADVRARMTRQASRDERLARADFVIHNDGDLDALAEQVDRAWAWIEGLGQG
jgi:dephospho-CoA kinase